MPLCREGFLKYGVAPAVCLRILRQEPRDPRIPLPTLTQVGNLKKRLLKAASVGTNQLNSIDAIKEWADSKIIKSKEAYSALAEHDVIVLGHKVYMDDEGKQHICYSYSCKGIYYYNYYYY